MREPDQIDWSASNISVDDVYARRDWLEETFDALYDADTDTEADDTPPKTTLSREDWGTVVGQVGHPDLLGADDLMKELCTLNDVIAQAGSADELISENGFDDYIKGLVSDCYPEVGKALNGNGWPMRHITIDWEAAIDEAKQDCTEVDVEGHTFYAR